VSGVALLAIFVLAVFVGFEVVSKVSTTLHTPLMSGANAIHGIILVGAVLVTGEADFVVTDRMLEMFKGRSPGNSSSGNSSSGRRRAGSPSREGTAR
jgi:NAD(P) transhydrogenase subunit alpha